jgi:hypothetical protein
MKPQPTNSQIADVLERIAELLEAQEDNPFRVRAYREGAQTIRNLNKPVVRLIDEDQSHELTDLPNIGEGIAAVIGEYVSSGKSELLQDLESAVSPEAIFANVPGIGPTLARRITKDLHLKSLPELEEAAHNGRLARVEGFGSRRVKGIRTALASMLSRSVRARQKERTAGGANGNQKREDRPSVELLLKIDSDYRKQAKAGKLHKIAPRRFNADGEAWLPVLHTKRSGWKFTALYSNTAQAHKLEKTDDWVVIYYERDGKQRQHTVVTETQGPLKGKRVVRGRDPENRQHYGKAA